MNRKTFAIILSLILALAMLACGDGGVASLLNGGSQDAEEEFTEIPGRTVQGPATVDVGDYIVDVPEGWLGIADLDWNTLKGDGPVGFTTYGYDMVKGAETSQDNGVTAPSINIFYDPEMSVEEMIDHINYMDEMIELDLQLEGRECKTYRTVLNLEDQEPNVSEIVFIRLPNDGCIRFMINVSAQGVETGLNIEDSDVLAVMNILKMK